MKNTKFSIPQQKWELSLGKGLRKGYGALKFKGPPALDMWLVVQAPGILGY